ncbi:MAG: hypothetical protein GF418_15910 [Chitinivibrionales bacterium]|nr:hypothetical protein [Chitinivibrionales bacterium]MBD3397106.1 hypothetical protein [Chitinivibrionales bacterium]
MSATRIVSAVLIGVSMLLADVVYLKDGGWVEGVVTERTAENVTVDLGFGTTVIESANIERVERGDAAEARSLQSEWGETFFDQGRFVPARLAGLGDTLSLLTQARSRAVRWHRRRQGLERDIHDLRAQVDSLRLALVQAGKRVKQASPHGNVRAYNHLVAEAHGLRADIDIAQHELALAQRELDEGSSALSEYSGLLGSFEKQVLRARKSLRAITAEERAFFGRVEGRLKEFRSDFETTRIEKPRRIGRHLVVTARINGTARGRFILDTGASLVSFSRDFADRLRIAFPDTDPIEVTLANGERASARPVMLRSVTVQDATVENVAAVMLEKPPGEGVDGLLGMSFLGKFQINIDVHGNVLELQRFTGR